jgi:hypothetical protein
MTSGRASTISASKKSCIGRLIAIAIAAAADLTPIIALADEGGVSFWEPGSYASLAAVSNQPGWSFGATYNHISASAGAAVAAAREIRIGFLNPTLQASLLANTNGVADSIYIEPSYVFTTPILGARAAVTLSTALLRSSNTLNGTLIATLGPLALVRSDSITDTVTGFGDLSPTAVLYWNKGIHNFMVYGTGNIPVPYQPLRLSNLGIGHGAMDAGGGYTYYNADSGYEFSAVAGLTYNLINNATNYQSGVDFHLDLAGSKYLSEDLFVGPVGYVYNQLGCDSGSGDRVGCFESRIAGLGAQIGYSFPLGGMEGYLNLRGYGEFTAQNRASGWSAWLTFEISPPEPDMASAPIPKLHK